MISMNGKRVADVTVIIFEETPSINLVRLTKMTSGDTVRAAKLQVVMISSLSRTPLAQTKATRTQNANDTAMRLKTILDM